VSAHASHWLQAYSKKKNQKDCKENDSVSLQQCCIDCQNGFEQRVLIFSLPVRMSTCVQLNCNGHLTAKSSC